MKHLYLFFLFLSSSCLIAQTFEVEAIKVSGDISNRINLVILSEGYQTGELETFKNEATNFTNAMFNQSPFSEYTNYFNVYIIKVPSNESGADHPGTATNVTEPKTPVTTKDTYFNATYDAYDYHRFLYYELDENNSNNTATKINNLLATNFPNYDQALIIVNSNEYGGTGGEYAIIYNGQHLIEVGLHEFGHSLFDLKDEYYPGDSLAAEAINMTQETNPELVKWKNWLNLNGIGIYPYGTEGNEATWYRPHQECKMRTLYKPFCSVCKEGIIEKIHDIISPIDSYSPISNTLDNSIFPVDFQINLVKTNPNTLETSWILNSEEFASNTDKVSIEAADLNSGINTLTVTIHDNASFLKVDNHETTHINIITWTIDNTLELKDISSEINRLKIKIYPNPSADIINIDLENTENSTVFVEILTIDGKKIKRINLNHSMKTEIDLSSLSQGIYLAEFYRDNALLTNKKIIKK